MATFVYPSNSELMEIEPEVMAVLTQDDPIFDFFPIENLDADQVIWDQEDNSFGLQQVRGLNGDPPKVNRIGYKTYRMSPGYYGEHEMIDEEELTRRRQIGTWNAPVDITDLVRRAQDHLLAREVVRIKVIGWNLLANATFSVSTASGAVAHTDTYDTQDFDSTVGWGTAATATPLGDFRAAQLLGRGHGVDFGRQARALMNLVTWNKLINNGNAADLYGRRTQGLGTYESLEDINKLLMGDNLPAVEVYDDGYFNDAGTWVSFIPDDKVILVGKRKDGGRIGAYKLTRNANNPNLEPGSYTHVVDSLETSKPVPRQIVVHRGHNGGVALYYPSAIVVMNVAV
jgi:hypothetical protein